TPLRGFSERVRDSAVFHSAMKSVVESKLTRVQQNPQDATITLLVVLSLRKIALHQLHLVVRWATRQYSEVECSYRFGMTRLQTDEAIHDRRRAVEERPVHQPQQLRDALDVLGGRCVVVEAEAPNEHVAGFLLFRASPHDD